MKPDAIIYNFFKHTIQHLIKIRKFIIFTEFFFHTAIIAMSNGSYQSTNVVRVPIANSKVLSSLN